MTGRGRSTTFQSQAAEVREIAKGIFDQKERSTVLHFVAESVKLAKAKLKT
jgi:hypothetical protein